MLCESQWSIWWHTGIFRLNPCSNGRCSARSLNTILWTIKLWCLNPCSNGRCSAREVKISEVSGDEVLILVLMEDALRERVITTQLWRQLCLNPCSNGRCSASLFTKALTSKSATVLILVLMEDALREVEREDGTHLFLLVLILVLMEDALREKM